MRKAYYETGWFQAQKGLLYGMLSLLLGIRANDFLAGWVPAALSLLFAVLTGTVCCALAWLAEKKLAVVPKKTKRNVYAAIISFFSLYGITLLTDTKKSVLWLVLYAFFYFGIKKMLLYRSDRKTAGAASVLALLFSLAVLAGHELSHYDTITIWNAADFGLDQIALQCLSFAGLLQLSSLCMNTVLGTMVGFECCVAEPRSNWKEVLTYAGGIMLLWFPYYLAFYPGILDKDSISEVAQQLGLETLSNHHPIMHQLVIGMCLRAGNLFGSLTLGVGLYTALQMILMALIFALSIVKLKEYGAGNKILAAVFLFYAVFTVNGFFAVTMWKDVLFGGLTLLLVILLLELFRGNGNRSEWGLVPFLVVVAFLFSTMRNNGYYAFVLGTAAMILLGGRKRKKLLVLLVSVITLVTGYHFILFDAMGIRKSRTAEALSVPLQQIARTMVYVDVDLDDENFTVLREVFPDIEELREDYVSVISDGVKHENVFESEVFDENPVRYMKAWAKIGARYPKIYIEAFLLQNYGYWYPDVDYAIIYPKLRENSLGLEANQPFSALRQNMIELNDQISKQEPTSILYSVGLMVWLMAASGAVLLLKKQQEAFFPMLIPGAIWLTTLASPVFCEYRYIYGLIVCVPLCLSLAVMLPNKQKTPEQTESFANQMKEKKQ